MQTLKAIITLFSFLFYCATVTSIDKKNLSLLIDKSLPSIYKALETSVTEVNDRNKYPSYGTKTFQWQLRNSSDWTSGFYPGTLWLAYELSSDKKFKQWAIEWTAGIEREKYNSHTHDLGFRFLCSFGNGLRLAPNDIDTLLYRSILLQATATADSRYSHLIKQYPSDWDDSKKTIPNCIPTVVDVMMNLELFFWAADNGFDKTIINRCIEHANTSMRDFVRSDGSTYHVVRYDKTSGVILNKGQLQGDEDHTTWSRGQAWMIYGYVVMYRYTKDSRYLSLAKKLADYFIEHLPVDKVANWDFQSTLQHRDASASAIVASALFEMQTYIDDVNKQIYYRTQAEEILFNLLQPKYFTSGNGTNALLYHSTQYYHRTDNTDVPSTFADYYFLEAIVRYKKLVK